jgi:hypothetical protein
VDGLVFIGASLDPALRAFDLKTGKEVWQGHYRQARARLRCRLSEPTADDTSLSPQAATIRVLENWIQPLSRSRCHNHELMALDAERVSAPLPEDARTPPPLGGAHSS